MKKVITFILVAATVFSMASAYNSPVGGEDFFELSSPEGLAGNQSVTGGALFSAGADSVIVNPALGAGEQRVNLNLGYTFLHSGNQLNNYKIGNAFQTGILIPIKYFVFSGYINGTFVPFNEMNLNNSFNFKLGLSKEITDKLDVGINLNTGVYWDGNTDWALSGDLGFNYNFGNVGFMKDFRFGMSVLNLGKNYSKGRNVGIFSDAPISPFPTMCTVNAGVAASLFRNDIIDIGASLDFSTPFFQNLLIDGNIQFAIKNMFVVSVGEKFNMVECVNNHYNFIPSVGISFKFSFDVKNNQYLERNGWSESEMTVLTAYKNMYNTVNAASIGVDIDLGMEDTTPPVIKFLDEE